MSKGKLWGIILLILFVLGFGIWLYTSSDVKKDSRPGRHRCVRRHDYTRCGLNNNKH